MLTQLTNRLIAEAMVYPAVIQDSTHSTFLNGTLRRMAALANEQARKHLFNNAPPEQPAAAAVCSILYSRTAQAALNLYPEDVENKQHLLNLSDHEIADARSIADNTYRDSTTSNQQVETVFHLANSLHTEINRDELKRITDNLNAPTEPGGHNSTPAGQSLMAATVATVHQIASQGPPFQTRTQDDLSQSIREETDRAVIYALTKQEERLPVRTTGAMAHRADADPRPQGTPLTPAYIQVGFYEEGDTNLIKYMVNRILNPGGDHEDPPPGSESEPPWARTFPYIAFVYQGTRYIKALTDPYPKGFPQHLAVAYAKITRNTLDAMLQERNPLAILSREADVQDTDRMLRAAGKHLHDLSLDDIKEVLAAGHQKGLPTGARMYVVETITNDRELTESLTDEPSPDWRRAAGQEKAKAVIQAARNIGLDDYALITLAEAMGHYPVALGIPETRPTLEQITAMQEAAEKTGVYYGRIEDMVQSLSA